MKYESMTKAQKLDYWDARRKEVSTLWSAARLADFSLQVKSVMIEKGVSKQELALRLGWPAAVVSEWISGSADPTMMQMYAIADALEVPLTVSLKA